MSAPVDVLAWLDAQIASHKALSSDAYHAQELPRTEAVRAAVAELIAAANAVPRGFYCDADSEWNRLSAALARVGAP